MKVTYEEKPLEELNNNVVEYVLKSPHNTNPTILRQMLNSRGSSAPASVKQNIIFRVSGDKNQDGIDDYWLINPFTEEEISPQDFARIMLSGNALYAIENYTSPLVINGKGYDIVSILGFSISSNEFLEFSYTTGFDIHEISLTDTEFVQAFAEAML